MSAPSSQKATRPSLCPGVFALTITSYEYQRPSWGHFRARHESGTEVARRSVKRKHSSRGIEDIPPDVALFRVIDIADKAAGIRYACRLPIGFKVDKKLVEAISTNSGTTPRAIPVTGLDGHTIVT